MVGQTISYYRILEKIVVLGWLAVLITSCVQAKVIPGRWEKVDALQPGKQIIVTLKAGDRIEGSFRSSGTDNVTVVILTGGEVKIAKPEVQQIMSREKVKDSLNNGAIVGIGIGLGIVLAGLAIAASGEGEVLPSAKWAAPLLGIGAGLSAGIAIDASHQETEVLYEAP